MAVAEQLRLFVAVELPPGVRAALAGLQRELRPRCGPGVRWVDAEGIHLTLKFLGNIEERQVPPLKAALGEVASEESPFTLCLTEFGAFPTPRSPRVLWVGVGGVGGEEEKLARLQRAMEERVSPLGFPREERPFSPHLTLGRVRAEASPLERRLLGESLAKASSEEAPSFLVDTLSLMQSTLTPQGARYHALARFPLGGSALPEAGG